MREKKRRVRTSKYVFGIGRGFWTPCPADASCARNFLLANQVERRMARDAGMRCPAVRTAGTAGDGVWDQPITACCSPSPAPAPSHCKADRSGSRPITRSCYSARNACGRRTTRDVLHRR